MIVLPLVIFAVELPPFLATLFPPSLVATLKLVEPFDTNWPLSFTVIVSLSTFTSKLTLDVVPSLFGSAVTVIPLPFAKFTVLP